MYFHRTLSLCLLLFLIEAQAGEFFEDFDGDSMQHDPSARNGWAWQIGDGQADMEFSQAGGYGHIEVDARLDLRNIWWAYIRHSVSASIDQDELARSDRELRVEAKIRVSVAPRRVNLHFNHTRTKDYHSHLMEYDIPDTENWHVISMTTNGFDALPEDEVFVQMALMDWGQDRYAVEIDYLKVSVIDSAEVGPDLGEPLEYRPAMPAPDTYTHAITVAQDAVVTSRYPDTNFRSWQNRSTPGGPPLIAVGDGQLALLRWDLEGFKNQRPEGWAVLELTTEQVYHADTGLEEFGVLRVVEILGGNPGWDRETVTYKGFLNGEWISDVLNEQMVIDIPPAPERGTKTLIPISPPVLRRLLGGQTRGLAIYAQGAINATFYSGARENSVGGPKLYLNFE